MTGSPLSLAGRTALVTAGPTWVPLDGVRYLTNFSSGDTGLRIARALARAGAAATLLFGPGRVSPTRSDRRRLRILDFVTFDDLSALLDRELAARRWDVIVHAAAVADYGPAELVAGKLPSSLPELILRLRPLPKLRERIRASQPAALFVGFKLEVGQDPGALAEAGSRHCHAWGADLLVANDLATFADGRAPALLLDRNGVIARVEERAALARRLVREIALRLGRER